MEGRSTSEIKDIKILQYMETRDDVTTIEPDTKQSNSYRESRHI